MAKEKIVLGSGKLYCTEFAGAVPEVGTVAKDTNLLGYIQGGASLEYKPKFTKVTDDLGIVCKTVVTEEEATLKSGVLTWDGDTLQKMSPTARVSTVESKKVVKIGGIQNQTGLSFLLLFVHEDPKDGNIYVMIVGKNQSGWEIKFEKDKETVIDAEFAAEPMDGEGTLIYYAEDIKNPSTPSVANK